MKYIIEIDNEPYAANDMYKPFLYKAKGFKSLVFDDEGLSKLERFEEDKYDFDNVYDEAYKNGLNDAWNAARRIGSYADSNTWKDIGFRLDTFGWAERYKEVIANYTASEAIAKLREYEEQKDHIEIGDEVVNVAGDVRGIVVGCHVPDVYPEKDKYAVFTGAFVEYLYKDQIRKTNRQFPEIAEVLKKMQEGQGEEGEQE